MEAISQDGYTLTGSASSLEDAKDYIYVRTFGGWKVLVSPFLSNITNEWIFILHRF